MAMKAAPHALKDSVISRFPALTYFAGPEDHEISFKHPLYGSVRFMLNPAYTIEGMLMYNHEYDVKTTSYFQRLIVPGDVCLDVGANIGAMTIPIAKCAGPNGRVIAFEPGPLLFERLQHNLRLNHSVTGCVKAINSGVSDKPGQMGWRMDESNPGNAFLVDPDSGTVTVPVSTIDKEVHDLDRVDFIKIDVEGMEYQALKGAERTLREFAPTILFETWVVDRPEQVQKAVLFLLELGYGLFESDVPERRLKERGYQFDLMPTHYPSLPSNTVAIHERRQCLLNATTTCTASTSARFGPASPTRR